ncbi:hypothetical protein K438DRAFT_1753987 [Mycena galopus ATCC 62051]|nr:hypothetical protein K438DRAFT_1753987 [Mycena galopus ATCC 62051]
MYGWRGIRKLDRKVMLSVDLFGHRKQAKSLHLSLRVKSGNFTICGVRGIIDDLGFDPIMLGCNGDGVTGLRLSKASGAPTCPNLRPEVYTGVGIGSKPGGRVSAAIQRDSPGLCTGFTDAGDQILPLAFHIHAPPTRRRAAEMNTVPGISLPN